MSFLKWFINVFISLFLLIFVLSFLNFFFIKNIKNNELSCGILADPITLNPIQSMDSISAQVESLIFNGLVKYNEKLDIVGDLSEKWFIHEDIIFLFPSNLEAKKAQLVVNNLKKCTRKYQLSVNDRSLIIKLDNTDNSFAKLLLELFQKHALFPINHGLNSDPFLIKPIIEFTLRKNVKWHDGYLFTSADVLYTYQMIKNESIASPRLSDFELIDHIDTPDAWHVIVYYKKPFSPALFSWTQPILPQHLLKEIPIQEWGYRYNQHPIGTGPFKFDQWNKNVIIRLTKNLNYFRGSPSLDAINFRIFSDPLTYQIAFESGEIDFWNPSVANIRRIKPEWQFFLTPSSIYNYVGWNLNLPIFHDIQIRKALALSINISELISTLLKDRGYVSLGPFTPSMWFFNHQIQQIPYNPVESEKILDNCGWKKGADGIRRKNGIPFSFTLLTNNGNELRRNIAILLQDNWQKIGISAKIEIYEWSVFISRFINARNFDAFILGWELDSNSYDQYSIWHSVSEKNQGSNLVHYSNVAVDQLLEKMREEYDRTTIQKLAMELQKKIYDDQPYLFLFVPDNICIIKKGSLRMKVPTDTGSFIDTAFSVGLLGWNYNLEWLYRSKYHDNNLSLKKI